MSKPKVVAISDTHGFWPEIPECEILIHAGDFCRRGTIGELNQSGIYLFQAVKKAEHIVVIAGNHDIPFEENRAVAEMVIGTKDFDSRIHYLQDEAIELNGLAIYGTPWQTKFMRWAFNTSEEELRDKYYAQIPTGLDILVTHIPPFMILDETAEGYNVGSVALLEHVVRTKPSFHVFGHIHESYGYKLMDWENGGRTDFLNVSTCNRQYEPVNQPQVILQ